jgi:LysM repeat protein
MKKAKVLVLFLSLLFVLPLSVGAIGTGGIAAYPANPSPDNDLTKSWFIYGLGPGESKEDAVIIRNDTGEDQSLTVYAVDSTTNNVGGFALEKESDNRDNIGKWIEFIDETEFDLISGESREVKFKITIPPDASVGEHSGGIMAQKGLTEEQKNLKGGFIITTRLGVRIYETVPGEIIKKVNIAGFEYIFDEGRSKYRFTVKVNNDGNVTMEPKIKLYIKDVFFGKGDREIETSPLVPRQGEIRADLETGKPKMGKFEVTAVLEYEGVDGNLIIESYPQKITFWVIPWGEILVVGLIILVNVIFFLTSFLLKRREKKHHREYIVKVGDDLESIAKEFGMNWKRLAKLNKIKAPFKIKEGEKIKIVDKKSLDGSGKEKKKRKPLKINKKKIIWIVVVFLVVSVAFNLFFLKKLEWTKSSLQKYEQVLSDKEKQIEEIESKIKEALKIQEELKVETATSTDDILQEVIISKEEIDIKILNGNGLAGVSGSASSLLEEKGYIKISVGNADRFNYEETIIECPKELIKDVCDEIKDILSSDYENIVIQETEKENEVVIILGK